MLTSRRRFSSSGVALSSRVQIDQLDAGLQSVQGAEEIISMICGRRAVDRMILGHNDLQDDGCSMLFNFLRSVDGKQYRIFEISLNSNGIGNKGLLEIGEYLRGNEYLRELFIQNNCFIGDPVVATAFAESINTSRLTLLSLTTNRNLGDEFAEHFLGNLDAPNLRELHLSATGLTSAAARHIADYLASPRCKLRIFRCNGNSLGLKGVRTILRAIRKHNYHLLTLELYANHLSENDTESASTSDTLDSGDEGGDGQLSPSSSGSVIRGWVRCEQMLKRLLFRNETLKKAVKGEALQLLRYTRTILLQSGPRSQSRIGPRTSLPPVSAVLFNSLPPELQLHIFSLLAPTLSPAQLVRVYEYASSPHTLPSLLPRLPTMSSSGVHGSSSLCYPDPSILGFRGGKIWPLGTSSSGTAGERCSNAHCMGTGKSILCQRDKERECWLETIGCSVYEPHVRSLG